MAIRTATDYYHQLVALLPPGPAWDVELVPEIRELLQAGSVELAREDLRLSDLLAESDPDTVRELVPSPPRLVRWTALMVASTVAGCPPVLVNTHAARWLPMGAEEC
ncbi:hypothetical protein [Pseudomonas cedrina]|uniref:hypothetical protein n=1 Tax=Pseudomonas cedrina TaxID=651740 RepID=UPI00277FE91D|nr:hypothetical protein [Pseudomonas cedrina]MDQ0653785.1 hypothetical protein [Pseudomonas cedrina]